MNRNSFLLAFIAAALVQSQFVARAEDWPGVWVEAEAGHGDVARKSVQYGSGNWVTDWHEKGGLLTLDLDVPKAISHAVLYLRYASDDAKAPVGQLDAYVGPQAAEKPTDSGVRHLGQFALPYVGPLSSFRWVRLPAGDLAAGKQRLILSCPQDKTAGYLDMIGIIPGDLRGLWTPPNKVIIGEFKDKPVQVQPMELLDIQCPTIGNWLPEAEYLGKGAKPVDLALEIRNNLCPDAAAITLKGIVTMEGGRPVELPVQKTEVASDTTRTVHYTFAVPQKGHGVLKLTLESEGQSVEREIPLATSAIDPVWTELKKDGKPIALAGPDARYAFDVNVPSDLPGALLYMRYDRSSRAADDGAMDVYIGPKDAANITDAQVRKLGRVALLRSDRQTERTDKSWGCVNAGHLNQGAYRVFFVLNEKVRVAEPGQRLRYDQNNFHAAGLVSDAERGLWLPATRGEGLELRGVPSMREPVVAERLVSTVVGGLFSEDQYLGTKAKEMSFTLSLRNNVVTAPMECVVHGELVDEHGVAAKLGAKTLRLDPGASLELPYPVKAPGFGWFDLHTDVESAGHTATIRTGLGVIHPAAKGVRPDSMFGLSVGDKPEDMEVAELIGVKWRRGIPHTNPADVLKKTGDPFVRKPEDTLTYWNEQEISAVRDVIHQWKDHGVLCLGFVNYNLPWNCLGGGAGGWHRNRPEDMKIHTDMVYHLIQPLHDEVKYWEIWNEPWIGGWTWRSGTAQDYRDMSRMIWDRVKPEMPDVKLIGGGSTAYQRDVVFAAGSKNAGYVDGVSTHPYGKPDMNHPSFAAIESALLKKYSKSSEAGIWATELGTAAYMFAPLPRNEEDLMVARTVAPLYLLGKLGAGEMPIRPFFFTSLYGPSNFSGGEHNLWDDSAGVPAPRPALVAYSAMTHFLEDSKLVGDIYAASKSAWALHFVKPDGTSIVVLIPERRLSGEFTPATFDASERQQSILRLPAADFAAYDFLGRPIGQREGDRLKMPMQTWEARYLVSKLPQEKVREAINGAEFEGLPSLLVNPRSFDAPLGDHPKLRVKVENLLPRVTDAHVEVNVPKEIRLETTSTDLKAMKPGEIRFAEFAVVSATPNEINRYKIRYRATAGGVAQEGDQVVQVACATYGTPNIDGDLSDWKDAIPVTMVARGGKDWREIALNPDKAADLLAQKDSDETVIYRLWTKWDAQNFYVAAQIPDSTFERAEPYRGDVSTTKNMPYMGDCLQLAFHCLDRNPDDLLRGNPLYEKSLGADIDYEFCAAQISNGHSELHRLKAPGTNYQSYYPTNQETTPLLGAMQADPNGGPEGKVVTRYDKAAKAWYYEVAIPWTCIQGFSDKLQALQPGQTYRTHFAFAVNDSGGRNRTFWTQEAGDLQAGSYGFSPNWGGGGRQFGGRILTDWGFTR